MNFKIELKIVLKKLKIVLKETEGMNIENGRNWS